VKQINNNKNPWHHLVGGLLALLFLIFGSSAHIPIADAIADSCGHTKQHQYDYTAEAEETLEEKQEELGSHQTGLGAFVRKHLVSILKETSCRVYDIKIRIQVKFLELLPRHHQEILLATGRIHSLLPG
jgi:hypothetical protein